MLSATAFPYLPTPFIFLMYGFLWGKFFKKDLNLEENIKDHGLPYPKVAVDVFWLWLPTHAPWWCVTREKLHTTYLSHHWEASHMTCDTATMSHTLKNHFPLCDAFLESMCCSHPLHINPQCLATQSEILQDHFQFCSIFLDSCLHGTYLNKMWQGLVLPVDTISVPAEDIVSYDFLKFWDYHLTIVPLLFSLSNPPCFNALFKHQLLLPTLCVCIHILKYSQFSLYNITRYIFSFSK